MTIAVPIEAARTIRQLCGEISPSSPLWSRAAAIEALVGFAEHFAMKPLPGMSQEVVAGEIPEVRLLDDTLEAEEIGIIRLNGRVYVPEEIEVVETFAFPAAHEVLAEMLAVARAGGCEDDGSDRDEALCDEWPVENRAQVDLWQAALRGDHPEDFSDTPPVELLLEDELRPSMPSLAETLIGMESITRRSDNWPSEPGAVTVAFDRPGDSWQLFNLLSDTAARR